MNCEICDNELVSVYEFLNSPIPNDYYVKPRIIACKQNVFYCDKCFYVKNVHQFGVEQIYNNYLYRTPKSNQDQGTIDFLKQQIHEFTINNIVEIGGNNGVFAEKLLEQVPEIVAHEIWDRVPLAVQNDRITHNDQYLSENSISKKETDLVIVRHAFAHNPSISSFAKNIIEILNPKYLYIECADWNQTIKNSDFSQLYTEHYYCLSPRSISQLFEKYEFYENDCVEIPIHNGSFGIFLSKNPVSSPVNEVSNGVKPETVKIVMESWADDCRNFWKEFIDGKSYIIWGCSAKLVFTLNTLGIDFNNGLKQIIDSTPQKEGLFPPGFHVPISTEASIIRPKDFDVIIIGARNFSQEISAKIKYTLPHVEIIVPPF